MEVVSVGRASLDSMTTFSRIGGCQYRQQLSPFLSQFLKFYFAVFAVTSRPKLDKICDNCVCKIIEKKYVWLESEVVIFCPERVLSGKTDEFCRFSFICKVSSPFLYLYYSSFLSQLESSSSLLLKSGFRETDFRLCRTVFPTGSQSDRISPAILHHVKTSPPSWKQLR